jgi:integrase
MKTGAQVLRMGADLHFSRSFVVVFLPEASLGLRRAHFAPCGANCWLTVHGGPADLEGMVRKRIRARLVEAGLPWRGLHAFRRGLATNLHALGVAGIVSQAILRHSDVSVTRQACIKNDAVDPRSLAAMEALESAVCDQCATGTADDKTAGTVN